MGGGGGVFFPSRPRNIDDMLEQSQNSDFQKELESGTNSYMQGLLIDFNNRDSGKIQEYLKDIQEIVGDKLGLQQLLFGGSVAKHTYVDGLSDVDVLAVVDKSSWEGKNPDRIIFIMSRYLDKKLTGDKVVSVEKGNLAVTVNYRDGTQIQILPALRKGEKVLINDPRNKGWNETLPTAFKDKLTTLNGDLNNNLVPTIKLAKAVISKLPEQKRSSGYHTENLALEVFRGYKGPCTHKAMIQHFFDNAGDKVLNSIKDVTGQSRAVDSYLGASGSAERKIVADGFASISRKMNGAFTVDKWKKMFED